MIISADYAPGLMLKSKEAREFLRGWLTETGVLPICVLA